VFYNCIFWYNSALLLNHLKNITMNTIKNYLKDEDGATMIEYALIAALVAIAAVVILGDLGKEITAKFDKVVKELKK
jgi:pilus assembly protein Flp/PilA